MPVAKQRKHQQQKCDQQQSGSFRRVNSVAPMLVIVLGIGSGHATLYAADVWILGVRV